MRFVQSCTRSKFSGNVMLSAPLHAEVVHVQLRNWWLLLARVGACQFTTVCHAHLVNSSETLESARLTCMRLIIKNQNKKNEWCGWGVLLTCRAGAKNRPVSGRPCGNLGKSFTVFVGEHCATGNGGNYWINCINNRIDSMQTGFSTQQSIVTVYFLCHACMSNFKSHCNCPLKFPGIVLVRVAVWSIIM